MQKAFDIHQSDDCKGIAEGYWAACLHVHHVQAGIFHNLAMLYDTCLLAYCCCFLNFPPQRISLSCMDGMNGHEKL